MEEPAPTGPKEPQPSNAYLRYGGFGLQLLGGIGLGAWAGHSLDKYLDLKYPVFLLSFVLIVFSGMLYQMYKNLNKD